MNKEALNKLKELAQAATPGPWLWGGTPVSTNEEALEICRTNIEATEKPGTHFCEVYLEDGRRTALVGNGPTGIANAAFIAAANPTVIIELIAKVQTPLEDHNSRFAIDGAMVKGHEGVDPPPTEDHWLMPYWKMARELAEFKAAAERSAADVSALTDDAPAPIQQEPVLWVESENNIRDKGVRYAINSMCNTVVYHLEKPQTDNPVWPLYATPPNSAVSQSQAAGDAVDAARYRWLREKRDIPHGARNIPWAVALDPEKKIHTMILRAGIDLDHAIDAAMREQP